MKKKYSILLFWSLSPVDLEDYVIECDSSVQSIRNDLKRYIMSAYLQTQPHITKNAKVLS